MHIFELFDSPKSYSWRIKKNTAWYGEFEVGELKYIVVFSRSRSKNIWTIAFQLDRQSAQQINKRSDGITGSGNAVQVFSTFLKMLDDLIAEVKPKEIQFIGEGESRNKLYHRMFSKIKNYKLTSRPYNSLQFDQSAVAYTLTKRWF